MWRGDHLDDLSSVFVAKSHQEAVLTFLPLVTTTEDDETQEREIEGLGRPMKKERKGGSVPRSKAGRFASRLASLICPSRDLQDTTPITFRPRQMYGRGTNRGPRELNRGRRNCRDSR